ncbi:TetR/AcrR family transcriptional regulator [Phaeobacter sp. HF9A]|uniref:TetR/AcrR family transcriptional regulator n=1 Tax=Phaeobacter sp. HF9A TaxID=2721561 RepID=UPI00142F6EC1|nr:TetR/AcrR family transcriptional regulator [Phaeobacter sp. HF9A]NIZ15762.1 TetR/AcrR family transcriptional regulator [Phaeobacter sp. HF9A]
MATTRDRIIEEADRLFYEQGFEATSFADIAAPLGLSRGNFYYHFKTKDDILDAVIALRLARTRAMLEAWEDEGTTPLERIGCFIRILIRNRTKIMAWGCPVGTLVGELSKLEHSAQGQAAELFSLFIDWLAAQFRAAGVTGDTTGLATHLLARSQGVASLAQAFGDEGFIEAEVAGMLAWSAQQIEAAGAAVNRI